MFGEDTNKVLLKKGRNPDVLLTNDKPPQGRVAELEVIAVEKNSAKALYMEFH